VKRLALLIGLIAALAAPAAANAHPLGNFTVNRFSGIEFSGDHVYVKYVLDMAEIPAFQERQKITDERVYERDLAARIGRGLDLRLDGTKVALTPLDHALAFPPGAAGLRTLRFEAVYSAAASSGSLELRDTNFADRIGWKEVVLSARDGASARASSVPSTSLSHELAAYPKDLLSSPLEVTTATAAIEPGDGPGSAPQLESRAQLSARAAVRDTGDGGFASLIARDDLGVGVILISLALAFFWGSAHALSPGHGKAIVTAYLVGQRGKPRHAAALGLIVTATHTIGVFTLGFVTLGLSQFIVPEQLYPWIGLVSGLLVTGVGASVLFGRVRRSRAHGHHHHHHHSHGELGWRSLTAVGVSGGLLPCPSALVVLLAAISLHRIALGLGLIVAFSAGLALSITGIGLAAILAKRTFRRFELQGRVIGLLPAISALVIVIAGAAMTVRAIPKVS
jgi:nickel/cobalt exporter